MSIQYMSSDGLREATKQEFLTLVQHGIITPMTEVVVKGQKALASQIKGIVFPEIKRSQPEVEPEFELDTAEGSPLNTTVPLANVSSSALAQKDAVTFWTVSYALTSVLALILGLFYNVAEFYALAVEGVALDETPLGEVLLVGTLLLAIVFAVTFYQFVKQIWSVVPSNFARTTPRNAAIFSFIPIFNWYWWFAAFTGLFQDMNKTIKRRGNGNLISTAIIQFACIFWVISDILSYILLGLSGSALGIICDSLNLVISAAVTLPVIWYIRQKVVEFIDSNFGL